MDIKIERELEKDFKIRRVHVNCFSIFLRLVKKTLQHQISESEKYGLFSLACDNATEGLMINSLNKHLEQELTYPVQERVYVEYVA